MSCIASTGVICIFAADKRVSAKDFIIANGIDESWEFWQPGPPCDSWPHTVVMQLLDLLERYGVSFLRLILSKGRMWIVLSKDASRRDIAIASALAARYIVSLHEEPQIYEEWDGLIYIGGFSISL